MDTALKKLQQLKVVDFDWLDGTHDIGVIAEEVAKIIPEAVCYKDGKIEGIKVLTLLAVTIKAIQELQEK